MSVLSWSAFVLLLAGSASTWDAPLQARAAVSNRDGRSQELEANFERARAEGLDPTDLSQRLHAMGLSVYPELFELGLSGKLETLQLEGEPERKAVFDALCAFPPATLGRQLEALGPLFESDAGRLYGLEILGRIGTASEVDDGLQIAAWSGEESPVEEAPVSRRVRVALTDFLLASFDREEELTRIKVTDSFPAAPLGLTSTLIDALAEQYGRTNFLALTDLLLRRSEVDPYLLVVLSRKADGIALPVPERVHSKLRACYHSAQTDDLRALSMRVLGRLEDEASLPIFVTELESESALLSDSALDALRACTGRQYGRNPRSWKGWIRSEERWWQERSAAVFDQVCDGQGGSITQAIQAVAHRRLRRHELSRRIECVLLREEKTLVLLGCATLGHLGSWNAAPALVHLMERRREPEVAEAAHQALMKITGTSPPAETSAWRALLEQDR